MLVMPVLPAAMNLVELDCPQKEETSFTLA